MSQPIGIFDSGIGGLTVAHALAQLLPQEDMIYFGDTAHLPYGDKSTAAIGAYAIKITDMLLKQNCKLILIACNSASSAAYELVSEYVASKALVVDVIDPVIEFVAANYANKTVGVIGTKQTILSNIYKKKFDEYAIRCCSTATPLLAPAIEEGFQQHHIIDELLQEYLTHDELAGIEALILGCTHYPIIKQRIERFYENKIPIIDSAHIVAQFVQKCLTQRGKLNQDGGSRNFYVSDYTDSFLHGAKLFFEEEIELQHYPLWE